MSMQTGFNVVNTSNILYHEPQDILIILLFYIIIYDLGTCVARTGLKFRGYPTPHIHLILRVGPMKT
jgi:hypothetical protein